MLTVYNTKTRCLTLYHAKDGGFGIKGSTLLNWDETKSSAKMLRKPKDTLQFFVNSGFAVVQSKFQGIKTKPKSPNGRINGHTILLWVRKTSK